MADYDLSPEEKALYFDKIVAHSVEDIIEINFETGQGKTVYSVEPRLRKTQGTVYDYEDMLRKYLRGCCADPDIGQVFSSLKLNKVQRSLERSGSHNAWYTVQGEEGKFLLKEASFYRKDATTILLFIRDITGAFENVTERVNKLQRSLKEAAHKISEKNAFLNLMSRNIRRPLYSIMGLTRIAKDDLPENSSLDSYLNKISMSGTYMSETIDDILELRRIANHEIVLRQEEISMGDFLNHVRQLLQPVVEDRHLIFSMETDETADVKVLSDRHGLRQILLKLVQSAMNYTVKGGRIGLNVRELYRDSRQIMLEFSAVSYGIVIDQERLRTLFQPYDYLRERIEEDIGSLDMALIILKSYAMAMGTNTLTAETDEVKGTRISLSLTLPLIEEKEKWKGLMPGGALPDFSGLRVLIVDDNEINLEVGEKLLFSRGADVVSAMNGKEAVDVYERDGGRYDLIIMDILMPVMDGMEAARAIRAMEDKIPGSKSIPIIAMTADAFRENFEESFRSEMSCCLVKPISPEKLYNAMTEALKGR